MATYNAADGHVPDDDASLSAADKARIRSAGGAGAAAFLEALPNRWATQLTNEQMVIACKLRLGLPLAPPDLTTCICGHCLDSQEEHSLKCRNGGGLQRRHHGIVQAFSAVLKEARPTTAISHERLLTSLGPLPPQCDPLLRIDIVAESATRPTLLADPTVVHPVAANRTHLEACARTSGVAAQRSERAKARKYSEAARSLSMPFLPLAVETFGRLGLAATGFIRNLAEEKARWVPGRAEGQQPEPSNLRLRLRLLARWYRTISCGL